MRYQYLRMYNHQSQPILVALSLHATCLRPVNNHQV